MDEDGRGSTERDLTTALLDRGLDVSDCSKAVDDEVESAALDIVTDKDGCCTMALELDV